MTPTPPPWKRIVAKLVISTSSRFPHTLKVKVFPPKTATILCDKPQAPWFEATMAAPQFQSCAPVFCGCKLCKDDGSTWLHDKTYAVLHCSSQLLGESCYPWDRPASSESKRRRLTESDIGTGIMNFFGLRCNEEISSLRHYLDAFPLYADYQLCQLRQQTKAQL